MLFRSERDDAISALDVVSVAQPEQDGSRRTKGFFLKLAGWLGTWPAYEDGWASGHGDGMGDGSTGCAGW